MADSYTVSRLGAVNNTNTNETVSRSLFLKQFGGEVFGALKEMSQMSGKVVERTLTSGKSAQFPMTGYASASYHTPGDEIDGSVINHAELVVSAEAYLIADAFIAEIDEVLNHYEVRSQYREELAYALANKHDQDLLRQAVLASRQSAIVTGTDGGSQISDDDFKSASVTTKGAALVDAIFTAKATLRQKKVMGDIWCALRAEDYYDLVQYMDSNGFSPIHKDLGGAGSIADGEITRLAGVNIFCSENVPSTNASGDTYNAGDFSKTRGVIFHKEAVANVTWKGITLEMDYQVERQGTLMVAKMLTGKSYLRPACSVELKLDSLTN